MLYFEKGTWKRRRNKLLTRLNGSLFTGTRV